jgi:MscS family membrane protein
MTELWNHVSYWMMEASFMGNHAWQWAALLGTILGAFVVGKVISYALLLQAKRMDAIENRWQLLSALAKSLARPISLGMLATGLGLSRMFMTLTFSDGEKTIDLNSYWQSACAVLAVLSVSWLVYRLVDVVELLLRKFTKRTQTALDDQLVPLVRKTLRVFIVIVAGIFLAQNVFHWDIGAVLTGLGIGGLAFALAAKDMISNLFGSLAIFASRPFAMGDRITINGYTGNVTEVGFRCTRLLTLVGHTVTIPNGIVANATIENVSTRTFLKRVLDIGVTYDTPPAKLNEAVAIIKEMFATRAAELSGENPARVYFTDFNDANLNLQITYWFDSNAWWDYYAFNHAFNMELLERFNGAGLEFAFPTQTLYVENATDGSTPPIQDGPF